MYEFRGFTQKANKALNLSIESAQNFGHDYIGTEHILLGLIKEGSGVAAAALEECGVTAEALEKEIANVAEVFRLPSHPTALLPVQSVFSEPQ